MEIVGETAHLSLPVLLLPNIPFMLPQAEVFSKNQTMPSAISAPNCKNLSKGRALPAIAAIQGSIRFRHEAKGWNPSNLHTISSADDPVCSSHRSGLCRKFLNRNDVDLENMDVDAQKAGPTRRAFSTKAKTNSFQCFY